MSVLPIETHFRTILDKDIAPIADPTQKGHAFLRWVLKSLKGFVDIILRDHEL